MGFRLRYLTQNPEEEETSEWTLYDETFAPSAQASVLKHLEGGKDYTFQVCAFNAAGEGPWSDHSEPFLMPNYHLWDPDRAPPAFLSTDPHSIEINWRVPCHRGSVIVSYDILCSQDFEFADEAKIRHLNIAGDATTLLVDNLKANTVYYFRYRAVNTKGASAWSQTTAGASTSGLPPERPQAPTRLGEMRPFDVSIRWEIPESYNIPVQNYCVRRSLHQDMRDALEVEIGGKAKDGGVAINTDGTVFQAPEPAPGATGGDGAAGSTSACSSPSARRPGFSRGGYALTQLRVKGLFPGMEYFFQVMACNQIGNSPWSPTSQGMKTPAPPPVRCQKPRCLGGNLVDGMRICWPVPEAYGVAITRYDVRVAQHAMMIGETVSTVDGCRWKSCEDGSGRRGEQLVETMMGGCWDPGVSHFYQVRADSAAGCGEWSESSEEMKTDPERPLRPDAPYRFGVLPRALVVGWKVADCRGSAVLGYRLQYSLASDMSSALEIPANIGTDCEYAVAGLKPHNSYHFQVRAFNAVGTSDWSAPSRPVAVKQEPPNKMAAPWLVHKTSTSITVSFAAPADSGTKDGEMIQSYTLLRAQGPDCLERLAGGVKEEGGTVGVHRNAVPGGTEVKNLQPGVRCAFLVFAVNEFGESEPSDIVVLVPDPAAPDAPDAPEMVEFTRWSAIVKFLSGKQNGLPVTTYAMQCCEAEKEKTWDLGPWDLVLDNEGIQYCGVNSLQPGAAYRVRARVTNELGTSPWSGWSSPFFTETAPPDAVSKVTIEDVGSTHFRITWEEPLDYHDAITEYTVRWTADETFRVYKDMKIPAAEPRTALCDGLTPGSMGYASVAASNKCGYGTFGPFVSTQMDNSVPIAPARPRAVEVGPVHCKLSWMMPYDCGQKITHFWIRYKETATDGRPEHERHNGEAMVVGRKHHCFITPMFSKREYTCIIAAENSCGIGAWSPWSKNFRIGASALPLTPGEPEFVSSTIHDIVARWNQPEGMGAGIVDQVVRISKTPAFEEGTYRDVVVPCWNKELPEATGDAAKGEATASVDPGAGGGGGGGETGGAIASEELPLEERRKRVQKAHMEGAGVFSLVLKLALRKEANYNIADNIPGTGFFLKVAARNDVGMGPWSIASALMHTDIKGPDPIPQDPGIECLRSGCTTLTFGWQRSPCSWGAPVTHYLVRYAEIEEDLWKEGCNELVHQELDREEWLGMMHPEPAPPGIKDEELQDEEAISLFAEYLLVRFGTLEESWEWLDINRSGEVAEVEFVEGDIDNGPPFADFKNQEVLPKVFKMLDRDLRGKVSVVEFKQLLPYLEKTKKGSAGSKHNGVYCMVPGLTPGKSYYIVARAVNKAGMSGWTRCLKEPHITQPMSPAKILPLQGVPELRTLTSVTFRWELPYSNGAPLNDIELRYCSRDVEEPPPDRRALREGSLVKLDPDATTGVIPTEITLSNFKPGQLVFAVARAFNNKGGAREWSNMPGPGRGDVNNRITWDSATLPEAPTELGPPAIEVESLISKNGSTIGMFRFNTKGARTTGLPYIRFEFEMLDVAGNVMQEFEAEPTKDELDELVNGGSIRRALPEILAAGEQYSLRTRAKTAAGWSPLSGTSEVVRMPADRPVQPWALLSEFTSVRSIELKWWVPYHNGAPIERYEILFKLLKSDDEWTPIDERHLAENTHEHGHDGRRTNAKNIGSLTYRIEPLRENLDYVFKLRANNSVGWSDWSDESGFKTKAVKPARIDSRGFEITYQDTRQIKFKWVPPDNNGEEITRYEVLGGPNSRMVRWARLTQMILSTTVDCEKLFEFLIPGGLEVGERTGSKDFAELKCEECMYAAVLPHETTFDISELLPGQDYWFTVRAVNKMGRGEFSDITGPITTYPEKPSAIMPLAVRDTDERSCRFSFKFPYNMGAGIFEAKAQLTRTEGPLAHHEVDATTGEPHAHLASREWNLDIYSKIVSDWVDVELPKHGRGLVLVTSALERAFKEQGAEGQFHNRLDFVPSLENPTDLERLAEVDGLRPGTYYEIRWSCGSTRGWSPWSEPTKFLTEAMRPDTPEAMLIPSL